MKPSELIEKLRSQPDSIEFRETMQCIDTHYHFKPGAFTVGSNSNAEGENTGSLKILAFARLHKLGEDLALNLFGDFYRCDVLKNPQGSDHQNIRNFNSSGWKRVELPDQTLIEK